MLSPYKIGYSYSIVLGISLVSNFFPGHVFVSCSRELTCSVPSLPVLFQVAHVQPQLFAGPFCSKLVELMQVLVSCPPKWNSMQNLFLIKALLATLSSVLLDAVVHKEKYECLPVQNMLLQLLQVIPATETILRQCSHAAFYERYSMVPLMSFVLHILPTQAIHPLAVHPRIFSLAAKDKDANVSIQQLQSECVDRMMKECASVLRLAMERWLPGKCGTVSLARALSSDMLQACVDIKILASDDSYELWGHRIILCQYSSFFHSLFTTSMSEGSASEVFMQDMDFEILVLVLQWMYKPLPLDLAETRQETQPTGSVSCETAISLGYTVAPGKIMLGPWPYQTLRLPTALWLRVFRVADFLGVDNLVHEIISLLCLSMRDVPLEMMHEILELLSDLPFVDRARVRYLWRMCVLRLLHAGQVAGVSDKAMKTAYLFLDTYARGSFVTYLG